MVFEQGASRGDRCASLPSLRPRQKLRVSGKLTLQQHGGTKSGLEKCYRMDCFYGSFEACADWMQRCCRSMKMLSVSFYPSAR